MKTSFVILQKSQDVSAEDLIDTLKDYVDNGFSIALDIVIELIQRVELTLPQRQELISVAKRGYKKQSMRYEKEAAREYERVAEYLSSP